MFAGHYAAGLALPSAAAPSLITQRANAMISSPAVRLQGRYELGALVNERLGVSRHRGFDHEGGTPTPVIVVVASNSAFCTSAIAGNGISGGSTSSRTWSSRR